MEHIIRTIIEWLPHVLSWLISSASVAIAVFIVNEWKERKRLRVCCRLLFVEVNRHKYWFQLLQQGNRDTLNLLVDSNLVDMDWNNLKYDAVFARMPFEQFETLITHYTGMRSLQEVAKTVLTTDGKQISYSLLNDQQVICLEAHDILHKLAKPTPNKSSKQNNES